MSHYTKIETRLTSLPHLLKALNDLGFNQVESYGSPVKLEGAESFWIDETAEVVIRKEHLKARKNDMGFKRQSDGSYVAVISSYDEKFYDEIWIRNLSQRYSYHVTRDTLEQKGFDLIEEEQQSGEIRLTLRRMT